MVVVGALFRTLPCSADLDAEVTKAIDALKSGDHARVEEAKVAIEKMRPRLLNACKEILNDRDATKIRDQWAMSQSVRNVAIELLGKWRAEDAVDVLIENLAPPASVPKCSWPFKGYPPASDALARIGKIATPKLLDTLATAEDEDAVRGIALALIQIEGFDRGKELLDTRIRNESNGERRKKLEAARERYLRLPKTLPPPGYDE